MYIRGVPAFFSASRAVTSAFLVISLFVGCASTEKIDITREREKVKAEKNKAIIVAKVGDVEITKERVELYAKFLAPKIIPHGDIRKERMNRIKVQALGEIVVKELKFNEARRQGISVDPESIEADVKKMEKRMASTGATLDEALAKQGRDRNWLRDFILKSRVVKILEDRVTQNIALEVKKKTGDDVVRAFYAENLDKFKEPDKVRILEILLKVPPGSPPKDWEKSKEKANWLIKRARAGDPFRSLAREFSDDSYAEKGGDMGLLKVTSLMGELSAVVSKMKVGDVAGPVYSIYGHHVVKLIDQKKGVQKPFESVRERITEHLSRKEKKNMFREWLDGLREKVVVEYLYDFEEEKMKG